MTYETAKKPLDKIDQDILAELSDNARIPIAELAKKVNLSRNGVRNRLSRLEASREIVKYTIERRSDREREMTDAFIMIDRHDRMRGAEVTAAIKKIDGVKACFVLSGGIDLLLKVEVSSTERLKDVCTQVWEISGVKDTKTHIVLSTIMERN